MPYHPKTGLQSFDSEWNKAVGWAQSQGIGPNSYLPVYQLDLTRIQNGEYPMGAAERNMAILAAHNPNQVTSNPADHPASPFTPSGAFHNAVSDAGKIATGLAGIFTGSFERQVWDSAKATFKGIVDPASLEAPTLGGTIGNWLNDTLLAYAPGAADIGTVLQHDPTLTGSSGFKALAQHPLVSILDIMPGEGGAVERFGRALDPATGKTIRGTGYLSERGSGRSALGEIAHQIGSVPTGKSGTTIGGQLTQHLSVKDHIESMMARLPRGGVGKAVGDLEEARANAEAMSIDKYIWLFDNPAQELERLDEADKARVQKILSTVNLDGGDRVREAIDDPNLSPSVKAVVKGWLNGPERYATEAALFRGELRATYSLSGDVGMWAAASDKARKVLGLSAKSELARRAAMKEIDDLAPHAERVKLLDSMRATATTRWDTQVSTARQEVFKDPKLQVPLTRELPKAVLGRKKASLSRAEQLHTVVGEGGLADDFKKIVRSGDPDQIRRVAEAMKHRLSGWGPDSVDAADHPALAALYRTSEAFEQWAKAYQRQAKEIDKAIYGKEAEQKYHYNEVAQHQAMRTKALKDRQTLERDQLLSSYNLKKRKNAAALAKVIAAQTEQLTWLNEIYERSTETAGARATRAEVAKLVKVERAKKYEAATQAAARIKAATREKQQADRHAWTEYQRDQSKMTRRHEAERRARAKEAKVLKTGMGDAVAAVTRLGDAIRAYHDAVADTPADQYKDVTKALFHKHLVNAEHTSALNVAADKFLRAIPGMTEKRLGELRANPQIIAEMIDMDFHEILNQPDLDPELAKEAKAEAEAYKKDAHETFKQLYARGLRIPYIPTATTFDVNLGRNSMSPLIGHGIPKPDLVKDKVSDLTPHIHDFAVGINKAVVQELHRQSTVHLAEHYLSPMALTDKQVHDFMVLYKPIEERVAFENTPQRMVDIAAGELGLSAFDPKAMFGFTLPRWSKAQTLYLPTPLVNTLKAMEREHRRGLLAKTNKVFRYSILGLSPRYDAHIIFGGAMMLALRSTPYMPLMIGKAARALRDGTIPREALRGRESELGFEEPKRMALNEWNRRAGHDQIMGLAVPEHIETRQKVKMAAAKPIHVLRALADINFRFTHYVRDLQSSLAYLDGVAKADRRYGKVTIEDPATGKMVTVSSERAVKEGIHHVQQVYGNLNRMSPVEKQIAQSFMPFYGWQKHILGYVMTFPFDHPWRALVLSQLAYNSSNNVPLAWPIRIQLLHFLGAPDAQGNVNAIDLRSLDPFRDVANYASVTGIFESLNPALSALPSIQNPEFTFGGSQLYPGLTYNAFYGINTATPGGSWLNAVEQFVPQVGAVQSAAQAAGGYRSEWSTNQSAAIKSLLSSLNIPFVTPPVNLKQIAARDETHRFEAAKAAAQQAFSSGDFRGLAAYTTVPNPLNSAYEITPAQLEELYRQAQQATPGVAPIESLLPPPSPTGF